MKIWTNTIVNNEENFIWFAVSSIVDFVDKVLIYDTGSTDRTVEIIKELVKKYGSKIIFKEMGEVNPEEFPKLRQQMLEESECDWILILDGDEIWWEDSIKKLVAKINSEKGIEAIVVPMIIPVGDIYHFQESEAGQYNILGKKGHLSLRALSRRIPGLHVDLPYGKESYFDGDKKLIQERQNIIFLDTPYLHVTHLERSSVKGKINKFKHEIGNMVSINFKYPEVLYKDCPNIVSNPWRKLSGIKLLKSELLTPFRKFKRRLIK